MFWVGLTSYYIFKEINLTASKANNTLTFFDNGIGMSEEEAINHLGTIAKSGSKDFMSEVQESDREGWKLLIISSLVESVRGSRFSITFKVHQLNQLLVSLELGSIQFSWLLIKLMFSLGDGMPKQEFIGHLMVKEDIQ